MYTNIHVYWQYPWDTQGTKTGIDNKQSYRVQQINIITGEIINTFHSFMEAERRTGISSYNFSLVLSGKRNKAGDLFGKELNNPKFTLIFKISY